jgi:nitroreductase
LSYYQVADSIIRFANICLTKAWLLMNPLEMIKKRQSSRTYLSETIKLPERKVLLDYLSHENIGLFGEKIIIQLIEHAGSEERKMKKDYGLITNHRNYLLGKVKNLPEARMSYGYMMEKVVLKATSVGLNTCWMGLFDPDFFPEVKANPDEIIPAVIIIGYAAQTRPLKEKIIRYAVRASRRLPWDSLFFIDDLETGMKEYVTGKYAEVLEMTRLSPSSGNSQPWRIVKDKNYNNFHFYKRAVNANYDKRGLHDVDIGICLSHFELSARWFGLEGGWMKLDLANIIKLPDIEYKVSWIGK